MIPDKLVDRYAKGSGLRDKLVAERDVVLTYALHALVESGVSDRLAFKGGTCLRKAVFGATGRFSEDLDFTLDTDEPTDDVLQHMVEVLNASHHGVTFAFEEFYKTEDDRSFGGDVLYRHEWNESGRFRLQVSLRERPTLPVVAMPLQRQEYFEQLEFGGFSVRSLALIEMIAEKVRAAFQRAKVRDVYDLHQFVSRPFDGELLRRLVVLKLWQVRDPFSPELLFAKLHGGEYDWDDIKRFVRSSARVDAVDIVDVVESRLCVLHNLTDTHPSDGRA